MDPGFVPEEHLVSTKPLSRRNFLQLAVSTTACAAASVGRTAPAQRPNIVLILVDDLGWADVGCYGSAYYETPSIDRLAREGMRFTNGYAACHVCSPTRAAVLTGRYPARLGVTDWIRGRWNGTDIPADGKNPSGFVAEPHKKLMTPDNALWMELEEVTIAELLHAEGYKTCHIGKWHLGYEEWFPEHQGFYYNIGGCDYGQPPDYFDPYSRKGKLRGDDRVWSIPTLAPRKEGEYLTDREADEAVGFIRKHRNDPFFLYWAPYAVHTPIQAKEDVIAKYKQKPTTHQNDPTYAAMVDSLDQGVGKVLDTLEEYGLSDNTVVIFTSDNGGLSTQKREGQLGPTSNKPLRSGKGYPYEGGIREPLIVRWPGKVAAGSESDAPAISCDILPTLCEATGVAAPSDRPIDGVSLLPILEGKVRLAKRDLFWHFPHYRVPDVNPHGIIRSGDWKLITYYEDGSTELYNLAVDLSETTDLAAKHPEKVAELSLRFQDWLTEVGAKMPKPNPDYTPEPS